MYGIGVKTRMTQAPYQLRNQAGDEEYAEGETLFDRGGVRLTEQSPAELRYVVAGMSCYTNSGFGSQFGFQGTLAPCCSYDLLTRAAQSADRLGVRLVPGPVFSSDTFYEAAEPTSSAKLGRLGVLAVEMEAYALYLNAAAAGKNALALLTISDSLVTGEALPAEDRQTTFTDMMKIALEIA